MLSPAAHLTSGLLEPVSLAERPSGSAPGKSVRQLWTVLAKSLNLPCLFYFSFQKFKEYLNGSNLITKLQAKHDLLKQTLGEGEWWGQVQGGSFHRETSLKQASSFDLTCCLVP